MPDVRHPEPSCFDAKTDIACHTRIRAIIGLHSKLSGGQRKVVETDCGMTGGVAVIDVRRCFHFYFLKWFGLDVDASTRRSEIQHMIKSPGVV